MATVMHDSHGERGPVGPHRKGDQLSHDRLTAFVVLAIMAAIMALVIWLATLGGGVAEPIDYWPMMP